ncbi:Phage protein Gp37/Gp68 [compost metagenome]
MGDNTKIEWADASWNPIVGCTKVSEGCRNCYAFDLHTMRHKAKLEGKQLPEQYAKPFSEIQLFPNRLDQPLRWKRPRKIFVNSLSDLFHPDVPDSFLDEIFTVMAKAKQHIFMVLTKRPERMKRYMEGCQRGADDMGGRFPWPNVWMGVTAENQQAADERIPLLLQTPAAVRWLSVEPMVGPVDLNAVPRPDNAYFWQRGEKGCITDPNEPDDYVYWHKHDQINWVVCGGESGRKARPMHPDWARSLRDQCQDAGVPFLFKQWGEWSPDVRFHNDDVRYGEFHGGKDFIESCACSEGDLYGNVRRVGIKKAGRLLDGKLWDQYPREEA